MTNAALCLVTSSAFSKLVVIGQCSHTKLLTIKAAFSALLCFPAVITSNFSFGVPAQATSETGIRFSLKSPAVGSTNRHCPLGAFIDTEVKARVAVPSRSCDSATAEGTSVPPARETGTASVGFGIPPAAMLVATGVDEADVTVVANEVALEMVLCGAVLLKLVPEAVGSDAPLPKLNS